MTRIREMKRVAVGRRTEYVVTLRPDGVEIRPKHSRRAEAIVVATWDWIYTKALLTRPVPKKQRTVKRGLL